MKEGTHIMSNLPEMVTPIQGTTWLSAVLELWLTLSLSLPTATDFPDEPQGNHSPPGCLKHTQLLQEMELKPSDRLFIISPHFGTPKRINVTTQTSL